MNNQDGNNVANANGKRNPLDLNDDQLIGYLAQYHSDHGWQAMNRNLYQEPTNPQACEQMKARVGSLSMAQLADYVVRILKQYNTNINTLKQFATEQVGGAVSLALGLGNDTIMGNNKLRSKLNDALRLPLVVDFNATGVAAAAVEQPPQQPIPMNYTPQVENHFSFAGNGDAAAAQVPAAAHHPVPPFEGFGNVTNAPFTTPARRGLRQPPLTPGSTFQPSFAPQAGAGGILSNSSIQGLCQPPLTPGSTYQPSHFSTPSVSGMNVRGQGYSAGGGSQYKPLSSYSQEENIHPNGSHWGGDEGSIGSLTNSLRSSHISRNLASEAPQVVEKLTLEDIKRSAPLSDINNAIIGYVSYQNVANKIRNGDPHAFLEVSLDVEGSKQNISRLNFDKLVVEQVASCDIEEESVKSCLDSIHRAAEQVPTQVGLDIKQIRAEAEARICDVNAQQEKDISKCLQNARRQLTDLEANVATYTKELTRLVESKKQRLTILMAMRKVLDIGYRALSYEISYRKNGGKPDEETMQVHQKLETELKALQNGIANKDVEFLKPLVWDQSVPAVDVASIWEKFHQVENNSK